MVDLHFVFLLLLLLELKLNELKLLVSHGLVLDSLALEALVLLLKISHNILQLLDPLGVGLLLLGLLGVELQHIGVVLLLQVVVVCCEFFVFLFEFFAPIQQVLLIVLPFLAVE